MDEERAVSRSRVAWEYARGILLLYGVAAGGAVVMTGVALLYRWLGF